MIDREAPVGIQTYRIKQLDIDGAFTYSDPVSVEVFSAGELIVLQSYPSPAREVVHFEINSPYSGKAQIRLYQTDGRLVSERSVEVQAGNQTISQEIEELANGYYLYEIRIRGQRSQGKLLKW
ncbi:MAG: T9SS type A sorting domain-containing protein, partial [Bacteroidota bacterium]